MLGLAVVLAGASVFLARNWIQEQARPIVVQQAAPDNTVMVVVAKDRMTFGNTVRKEQLRLVKWPGDAVPEGAFASIEEVVGDKEERVVLRSIEVNEPVLQNKLSGFGGKASLAAILSPDMRAVTIRVNDVAGVAGFVLPGDRVDVLLTRDRTGGNGGKSADNMITDVLLQNVKVLGIDQDANEDKEKPSVAKAVTLEVSPQQAQKLALASQLGSLALMLRNLADADPETVKTVTTRDLSVGEANDPPAVAQAPAKKPAPVKVVTKKKEEDPLSPVRIVRGTDATSYEVQPDSRPLSLISPPATKLDPSAPVITESEGSETKAVVPSGPTFVTPPAAASGSGQETQGYGNEQGAPVSILPPDLKAALN
jgi:pilus assembly protein CpaB